MWWTCARTTSARRDSSGKALLPVGDGDHARYGAPRARAHVKRLHCEPTDLREAQRISLQIDTAHPAAKLLSQISVIVLGPRRTSMRMSVAAARVTAAGVDPNERACVRELVFETEVGRARPHGPGDKWDWLSSLDKLRPHRYLSGIPQRVFAPSPETDCRPSQKSSQDPQSS